MSLQHLNKLDQLNSQLNDLLDWMKNFPEERLNRAPDENSWSAMQTMHHLMLSEKHSLMYVQKKMSFQKEFKSTGPLTKLRSVAINTYLNSPFKYQAPAGISGENLPAESSFWETARAWKQQRQELKSFLATLPDEAWKQEIYKHPAIGRLSFEGMLSFFQAHFKRHKKQIRKAIEY